MFRAILVHSAAVEHAASRQPLQTFDSVHAGCVRDKDSVFWKSPRFSCSKDGEGIAATLRVKTSESISCGIRRIGCRTREIRASDASARSLASARNVSFACRASISACKDLEYSNFRILSISKPAKPAADGPVLVSRQDATACACSVDILGGACREPQFQQVMIPWGKN